ncbi:SusC/RagA family TonB-linked outer membrane protein [Olivibacter sp. XZL3]|uniref:SusC/RagA family TonB-linked outer membrane protein n=1 Tax=Olivibacter sp. XZL3 TaxID=1735116 RepID=UPI002106C84F|nr:SusC/RagA family TonB-linked outer membrane protein [Olivibacter sp. XZL3]
MHGKIIDENAEPIAGATVVNKSTDARAITNHFGIFSIPAEDGQVLSVMYMGYTTQEVVITDNKQMLVKLEPSISQLNELVIVGYGSTQKKDLTGSVSIVSAKDIEDVPFTTIDNALAGKAPGVQITKSDGTPGGAVRIRVRGSTSLLGGNEPLYVVDGIPVQIQSNFESPGYDISSPVGNSVTGSGGVAAGLSTSFVNGLNNIGGLNPDDIESISILKDASSTAIYGSKAANGVIIITTKQGKKGMKPLFNASYYSTFTTPVTPDVLNASQYRMLITEAAQADADVRLPLGLALPANSNAILNNPETFFGNGNTDWINEVTDSKIANNGELSVQGGSENSKYFSSVAFNNTPGVVNNTGYQRVSGKLNLDNEIGSKFNFITNILLGYTDQDIGNGAYGQALRARPDFAPYDENGNYTDFTALGASYEGFLNPTALLTATNNAKTFNLLGSLSGIYKFSDNFTFKSVASLNMQTYNQRNYTPSYVSIGSFYGNVTSDSGIGSNSNSRLAHWFVENTLTYNKTVQDHSINALAGTSYETRKTSFFSATATGYPNDNVLNNLSSAVEPIRVTGDDPSRPQSYLLSFYLRANYGFKDKYLFTFTGRADGSSKFGTNNKWGYFPSGALAWRMSQENFLKESNWIDDIKIRGSYGLTGNQNIGDQMYRTLYSPYSYAGSSALVPTQLGNENIKWENAKQADLGIDIALFNRLQATVDYYDKRADGALLSLPVAPSSSYSSLLRNAVGIKNTGLEVALSGDILRSGEFKWNASINVTWGKSIVTKLDVNADLSQVGNLSGMEYGNTTLIEGQPLGLITGLTVTGLIRNEEDLNAYKEQLGSRRSLFPYLGIGDVMYQLQATSPDSKYPDFNTVLGNAAAKYYGGFNQNFNYKEFGLQFYFTFSQGGKLLWGDHVSSMKFVGTSNANVAMLDRYTPENPDTDVPRLMLNGSFYYKSNLDFFDASYLKLRTVTFNYNLSKLNWLHKANIKSASVFASATNLFTITAYPGNDPETSNDPYSAIGGYFDVSNYPTVRTFSLGLKAGF